MINRIKRSTRIINSAWTVLLSGLLFLVTISASAQPTFEHEYSSSASICNLEKSGIKYFALDNINNRCLIYDMDYTEFRTINLTLPLDYYLYNIRHVSQHTFNQDDLIEIAYIYSKYNPLETSYYYSYETRVINENGTEILKIPGAGHTEIIETENEGRKLLVYVYDFSVLPAVTKTRVYSLPASPLKSSGPQSGPSYRIGNPFPNPSPGGAVNIPVKLPPGAQKGYLILYNMYGQEVGRHTVNKDDQEITLMPGTTMIPGVYIYNVQSGKEQSESRKLVVE